MTKSPAALFDRRQFVALSTDRLLYALLCLGIISEHTSDEISMGDVYQFVKRQEERT